MVSAGIKKEFESELVYNKKFSKTNIKSYGDGATDFHDKELPGAGSDCACLAVIAIDSGLKKEENTFFDFPQVLLEECKYIKKM